jgi:hypothetical protein
MNITLAILNPFDSTVLYSMLMFSGFIDYIQAVAEPNDMKNEMTVYINSVYKKLDRQPPMIAANLYISHIIHQMRILVCWGK